MQMLFSSFFTLSLTKEIVFIFVKDNSSITELSTLMYEVYTQSYMEWLRVNVHRFSTKVRTRLMEEDWMNPKKFRNVWEGKISNM